VKTVSTDPPAGLFNRDAEAIARTLASRRVSPKGVGSGLRMLLFYINRGGRGLSRGRRAELERAKRLLQRRMHDSPGARRRSR
jgi:tRNA(adenine34) deaminase